MDLQIDNVSNDIIISNGDVLTLVDLAETAQQVKHRLQTFIGEWFLDLTFGPDYIRDVFKKQPSLTLVRNILTFEIESEIGDRAVLSELELALVNTTRVLDIAFTLREPGAEETITTQVVIG